MRHNPACVLSIAGTDPSGGAGISADIKAISATGGYAAAVVTVLVAQNTQGVQRIYNISADFVHQQLLSVLNDLTVQAVKIGMVHEQHIIKIISDTLQQFNLKMVVFDPVMVAKDGSKLLQLETLDYLKRELMPRSYLITPNLVEAEHLLGRRIVDEQQMQEAAVTLGQKFSTNVLIKGGHLSSIKSSDVVYHAQKDSCFWFHAERIKSNNTHGTGCSLSSAIASYLAQGFPLIAAIRLAKNYLTQAIQAGVHYSVGQGHGPVDHFYYLKNRV